MVKIRQSTKFYLKLLKILNNNKVKINIIIQKVKFPNFWENLV